MPTVLILGGSYAGLAVAHKLLKHTASAVTDLKVIVVNPSPKFYWNLASVRAVVPKVLKDEQVFQAIEPGFAYAGKNFEFIQGSAESIDEAGKLVEINTASGVRSQAFDHLIIATGARADANTPWKSAATLEKTLQDLHDTQQKIAAASSIAVGGGGSTGTEVAGELGFEYGTKKEISIITAGATLLAGNMTPAINQGAESQIEKLGVKIIRNTRVTSFSVLPSGQTELVLSDGQKKLVDLYLPTTGLQPNSSFVPKAWLDDRGYVITDLELRVQGQQNVWAIGDVSALQRSSALITQAQSEHLHKNLDAVLKGNKPLTYKLPTKDMMAVSLGRSKGTGYGFGFRLPSLMVYFAKAKTLRVEKMPGLVTGTDF